MFSGAVHSQARRFGPALFQAFAGRGSGREPPAGVPEEESEAARLRRRRKAAVDALFEDVVAPLGLDVLAMQGG